MRRQKLLVLLLTLASCRGVESTTVPAPAPRIITAPDKGSELEDRAYAEGQADLELVQEALTPSTVIDINKYTFSDPTQYVIGLLLDPCRNRAYDCCSDRFGEPAYTTAELAAKERISLIDENGQPLDTSVSRLGDRPSQFDPDCYVDSKMTPYRLKKTLVNGNLTVTRQYADSGCVGRLSALTPLADLRMPACWDRNDSINALASCQGVDGRQKSNCVAVGYMQTAYITQCYGAYALDNHCGTFLELHEPDNELILSQTRLLGEYTSGFRTTVLPLFFNGDRTRTVCSGDYEIWWVQRTRYNFIVQKKKKFCVVSPRCDFDFATNKYKNYHRIQTP
ncbi:TPA: hypothetical protein N0F65_001495 [Lagenidium giganteum]|uniref:Lipoprotein n=1 Tax=Lagenidium giganteum TaxID=4803 RepID=A0AAV2Z3H6_9STRA|nr:TPA: hypothetical protein N0F65_001495 [Lagenidium giganteum]